MLALADLLSALLSVLEGWQTWITSVGSLALHFARFLQITSPVRASLHGSVSPGLGKCLLLSSHQSWGGDNAPLLLHSPCGFQVPSSHLYE